MAVNRQDREVSAHGRGVRPTPDSQKREITNAGTHPPHNRHDLRALPAGSQFRPRGKARRTARVTPVMGRAVVSYDEQAIEPSAIERMIADAGYPATASPADDGAAEEAV